MPQIEVVIGGRSFEVACQPGEEPFLQSAAAMLDVEAQALVPQNGRMTEAKMLLMAALMLADKTAGLEDRVRDGEARIEELNARLRMAPTRVEVPVVPTSVVRTVEEVAAEAEALARTVATLVPGDA